MLSRRYKQLIGRYALLLIAGMALQFFLGNVDASFLSYPWSLVVAVNFLYILILVYAKSDAVKGFRRLYDRPAYLSSLVSMLVLTLLLNSPIYQILLFFPMHYLIFCSYQFHVQKLL